MFYLSISQDFRHEVNLLVKLRHPNIVQFLGAVTEKKPLMLITEYLRGVNNCIFSINFQSGTLWLSGPKGAPNSNRSKRIDISLQGDLHQYLKDKGALHPSTAVNFALDIARCDLFIYLFADLKCLFNYETSGCSHIDLDIVLI